MSEPPPPPAVPVFVPAWLKGLQPGVFAVAVAGPDTGPQTASDQHPPGRAGADRPGFDLDRLTLAGMAPGPLEALRRWMELDDGRQHLVLLARSPEGNVREYTPGELATYLGEEHREQLNELLGAWMAKRAAAVPRAGEQVLAAAAAWALHWRELVGSPPMPILEAAIVGMGESDDEAAVTGQVAEAAGQMGQIFERLETPRQRDEYLKDWEQLHFLARHVPVLRNSTDRLIDLVALHDQHAQRLRAVLEPDISDYRRDLDTAARTGTAPPVLDQQRAEQLALARHIVRDYTAAFHTGRTGYAQRLQDAITAPQRSLAMTSAAHSWRDASVSAGLAVREVREQRQATFAEGSELGAAPEAVVAARAYLDTRAAMLHLVHDALGRLTRLPHPDTLPQEMVEIAVAQAGARLAQAFGTPERARRFLTGQLTYLQQQPVPAHRIGSTPGDVECLQAALDGLDRIAPPTPWDADSIRQRAEALTRPVAPVAAPTASTRRATRPDAQTAPPAPAPGPGMR
ncbi:hypothetical protein OIE69_44510 (plasmid) [Actinacidiphila glaucinigra]|uniref:hypothetical protein n=1 Tax=Actinacidiphila glaucinigra TaxID=235986 RepID=UPI002DDA9830|nr:hypothetical protein [Actinacidiphila glaucinigra]WSD65744.1 hypothetical protein OIE69_43340 [Actinacidiphila glaucinigra]WSD65968.1 hypothetical protein OIE69_44510 [Actinacidiphila glaucinigra]